MNLETEKILKKISNKIAIFLTAENFILLTIFLFYCLSFNIQGSANFLFLLLTILTIFNKWRHSGFQVKFDRTLVKLCFAFLCLPFLVLCQILFLPDVNIKQLDAPVRFAAGALLLICLTGYSRNDKLIIGCYGVIFGVIGMGIWGWISTRYIEYAYYMDLGRGSNNFINPIEFGCFAVTLGFVSLILPLPEQATPSAKHIIRCAKIIAFVASLIATICSGSRAALTAIPLFTLLVLFHQYKCSPIKIITTLFFVVALALPISLNTRIYKRIHEGISDIVTYPANKNSSLGARFQMWQIATQLFIEHPMIGVGRGNYSKSVKAYYRQGRADEFLIHFNNAHNEYLNTAAEMGIFGLLSILSLLLFPGIFFYQHYCSKNIVINFSATAGLIFVGGYALFFSFNTLTKMSCQTTFYALSVVLFTTIIINEQAAAASMTKQSVTFA